MAWTESMTSGMNRTKSSETAYTGRRGKSSCRYTERSRPGRHREEPASSPRSGSLGRICGLNGESKIMNRTSGERGIRTLQDIDVVNLKTLQARLHGVEDVLGGWSVPVL